MLSKREANDGQKMTHAVLEESNTKRETQNDDLLKQSRISGTISLIELL